MPVSYVGLGSTENKTSATTTAVTITAPSSGNTLVVIASADPGADSTTTVTDNGVGGTSTWSIDVSARNGTGTSGVFTLIASRPNVTGSTLPTSVTVSWKASSTAVSIAAKAIVVMEVSGTATTSMLDKFASSTGASTVSADSGLFSTATTQAADLLVGGFGFEGIDNGSAPAPTDGQGGTYTIPVNTLGSANGNNPIATAGGSTTSNITTEAAYEIVNATNTYKAVSTTPGANWAACCVAYKPAGATDPFPVAYYQNPMPYLRR